jgi:hypothetical protein
VRSVSEGGYSSILEYCGGVSRSELSVGFWLYFSGLLNISGGHTILGRSCFIWTSVAAWIKLLLYQVHLYFVLAVFHHLFSSYIDIHSKLVFPRGGGGGGGGAFIQGHVDQKYLCSISCMLDCRTIVFTAVNISRCVTFILICMC